MVAVSPFLRPAEEADADRIAALSIQLGYPAPPEAIRERLRLLARPGEPPVLVAVVDGEVAGWVQVGRTFSLEAGAQAILQGLVVDEACRGRGLGAALVAAAEAWTRAQGLGILRVRTNTARTDTHRFYTNLGFQEVKRQVVFQKDLGG